jgi:hypothetical protein
MEILQTSGAEQAMTASETEGGSFPDESTG